MTTRHRPPPRRGFSLISLMVGLLISSIVALGLMSLFKATARSTAGARMDATNDEQLVAAMLRAQIALQDAGYGIDAAAFGTHLVVLRNAVLAGSALSGTAVSAGTAGNAVLWTMATGSSVQCAGLLFDSATDGSGGLKYLGPVSCTSSGGVGSWSSLGWSATTWIASPSVNPTGTVSFTATSTTCNPFGLSGLASTLRLTMNAGTSAGAALSDVQCLANFRT